VLFLIVVRVLLPMFAMCCCYFAVKRYILLKHSKLARICLLIEAITNLIRATYCAIDPITSQNIFSFQVQRLLTYVTVPWSLATSVLITLFWAESLSGTTTKIEFLSRFKVHFIVFLVLSIMLELFTSIVHAFRLSVVRIPIAEFAAVLGMCSQLVVALFFMTFGAKVIKLLRMGQKMSGNTSFSRRVHLTRMTKRLIGSGVGMTLFVLSALGTLTPLWFSPNGLFLIFAGMYFALQITSVFQIFAFILPPSKSSIVPKTPTSKTHSQSKRHSWHFYAKQNKSTS